MNNQEKLQFLIIKQLELGSDFASIFDQAELRKVNVNDSNNHWEFIIALEEDVEEKYLAMLHSEIKTKFISIANSMAVKFERPIDRKVMEGTLTFDDIKKSFFEKLFTLKPSLTIMENYESDVINGVFTVTVANDLQQRFITDSYSLIKSLLSESGMIIRDINVNIDEKIMFRDVEATKVADEENAKQMSAIAATMERNRPAAPISSNNNSGNYGGGKNAYSQQRKVETPVELTKATDQVTYIKLSETYKNINDGMFQGCLFDKDLTKIKSKKNGQEYTIITLKITDYTDSIIVKGFANAYLNEENYKQLKTGSWLRIKGNVKQDKFLNDEYILEPTEIYHIDKPDEYIKHNEWEGGMPRHELSVTTTMSTLQSIGKVKDYANLASHYQLASMAFTDYENVQSYPEIEASFRKIETKPIYGVRVYLTRRDKPIIVNPFPGMLVDQVYTVFDVETTGFSTEYHKIIEMAAIKVKKNDLNELVIVDSFEMFANPGEPLSEFTTSLTHITDEMVRDAVTPEELIRDFWEFSKGTIYVAHNAQFDMGHIEATMKRAGIAFPKLTSIDTLELSRNIFIDMKRHNLKALSKKLGVKLEEHHRAIYDTKATAEIFVELSKILTNDCNCHRLEDLNSLIREDSYKHGFPKTANILVKNQDGLKDLFKLVSESHTETLGSGVALLLEDSLWNMRKNNNILVGSSSDEGHVFTKLLEKSYDEAFQEAQRYDYLELEPIENLQWMVSSYRVNSMEVLKDVYKKMVRLSKELDIPLVVVSNAAQINEHDKIGRKILTDTQKMNRLTNKFVELDTYPDAFVRTTKELFESFSFLNDQQLLNDIILKNPASIVEQIEDVQIIRTELYTPKMDNAEENLKNDVFKKAHEIYGNQLHEIILARIEKELNSIIKHGFSVIYLISRDLVVKSLSDGYLVGSRGSVGSSFVATMLDITEVNPLEPHYYCPHCKYIEFFVNGEIAIGYDLDDKECPQCNAKLSKEGHNIPFETFLGFEGDKVPDIDLNFSGVYQPQAHNYTKVLFGEDHVFRAGTISTVQDNTAFGFVKGYESDHAQFFRGAEIDRLKNLCVEAKRTTGQHPGGIIVVPQDMEIYDFTPVQFPANNGNSEWKTTHFDFHSIHDNLLKLDILGHDDPTVIRMLQDLTEVDPKSIPLDDRKVMELFTFENAVALPEFGTQFVRQMLKDTMPRSFSDLVILSGLSHGTDVWLGNAKDLIANGTCTLSDVIGCRDDIMVQLMIWGLEPSMSFKIMEDVRKGKGVSKEYEAAMKANNVPQWYIDSCNKIKYMFPKAHATAYVMMAYRIAWFKKYYPLEFYSVWFSVRADQFDIETMIKGQDAIANKIRQISSDPKATKVDKDTLQTLEVAHDMINTNHHFLPIDIYRSKSSTFNLYREKHGLVAPLNSWKGLGLSAAESVIYIRNGFGWVFDELKVATKAKDEAEMARLNNLIPHIEWLEKNEKFGQDIEYNGMLFKWYWFVDATDLNKKTKLNKTHIAGLEEAGYLDSLKIDN